MISGAKFAADGYFGIYTGLVANREDPRRLARIKVSIPGLIDEESNWALPRTGSSVTDSDGNTTYQGCARVPPIGSDVFVQFLNGDIDHPIWEPAGFGINQNFPEHESPDVYVWGVGPFRLVIDNREDVNTATFKVVKVVSGEEQSICEFLFNANTNSVRLYATTAIQLESGGVVDIDGNAVQVRGRKVTPVNRPIN